MVFVVSDVFKTNKVMFCRDTFNIQILYSFFFLTILQLYIIHLILGDSVLSLFYLFHEVKFEFF